MPSVTVQGDSNQTSIVQTGNGNEARLDVTSAISTASVSQVGDSNRASILQTSANFNGFNDSAQISQSGFGNSATINQR